MKRVGNLMPQIASLENLELAFWKAQRGKGSKPEVWTFRQNLNAELKSLQAELYAADLQVGNYHYFKVFDPKERLICACSFREKVLHHALINVTLPYFERYQIYDSYACRQGKGTHKAVARAAYFCKQYAYFAKFDVRKFFETLDQMILKERLAHTFKDEKVLACFSQIIHSYENQKGKGVPIGNLTSQHFANHFLAYADHFAKEQLKLRAYVRYMDDIVFWENSSEKLRKKVILFSNFLTQKLACAIKPIVQNTVLHGLPFLGFKLSKQGVFLQRKTKKRYTQKITTLNQPLQVRSEEQVAQSMASLTAFVAHAKSYFFRKKLIFA